MICQVEVEGGVVTVHAEPYDKFLWLALHGPDGQIIRYMPQKFWPRDRYDLAEAWLLSHAKYWAYKVVEVLTAARSVPQTIITNSRLKEIDASTGQIEVEG